MVGDPVHSSKNLTIERGLKMYRIKQKGRYKYKCPTCGVYIKAKVPHCRGCIIDLFSNREAGEWRKNQVQERQEKKEKRAQEKAMFILNFDFQI